MTLSKDTVRQRASPQVKTGVSINYESQLVVLDAQIKSQNLRVYSGFKKHTLYAVL